MDWFTSNGGWMAPTISLASVGNGAGRGLLWTAASTIEDTETTPHVLPRGTRILHIPSHLQLSEARSVGRLQERLGRTVWRQLWTNGLASQRVGLDPLLRQDIAMALDIYTLLQQPKDDTQDCFRTGQQDETSRTLQPTDSDDSQTSLSLLLLRPYLQEAMAAPVQRLDVWNNAEQDLLMDPFLKNTAVQSRRQLYHIWTRLIVPYMLNNNSPSSSSTTTTTQCSFEEFHRLVAAVASRAMILQGGVKYLVPMADMMNHGHIPVQQTTTTTNDDDKKKKDTSLFTDYHVRDETDGSITVYTDRDFVLTTTTTSIQLLEEYGQLDNSLFLTVFGFVPVDNPHHCVMMNMPTVQGTTPDMVDTVQSIWQHWGSMNTAAPETLPFPVDSVYAVCVQRNGHVVGHDPVVVQQWLALILLFSIPLSNSNTTWQQTQGACQDSIQDDNNDATGTILRDACFEYDGHDKMIQGYWQNVAKQQEQVFREGHVTLEQDEQELDQTLLSSKEEDSRKSVDGTELNSERVAMALRFRIEDKKVWRALAEQVQQSSE